MDEIPIARVRTNVLPLVGRHFREFKQSADFGSTPMRPIVLFSFPRDLPFR